MPVSSIKSLISSLEADTYQFSGRYNQQIQHITWDYTKVTKNSMYFCIEEEEFQESYIKGTGLLYWRNAVENGASCIVAPFHKIKSIPDQISLLEVKDANLAMAMISKEYYGNPFLAMKVIGITGTNGKTTISQFLDSILTNARQATGIIGTIGIFYPEEKEDANHLSNPMATELFRIGRKMADLGVENLIMEVTSHGLEFRRSASIDFSVGIFTNLTQDHLDYHKTFQAYKEAKLRLFTNLGTGPKKAIAIINVDDISGSDFLNALPKNKVRSGHVFTMTYGILNKEADLVGYPKQMTGGSSSFDVFHKGNHLAMIHLPVPGLFNIYNALASFGAAFSLGISIESIAEGLQKVNQVNGRFEKVAVKEDVDIYIDYAHTPDSLENILQVVRALVRNRLILVFGCGGNRDKLKRPQMGKIAGELADYVWVTSDNPRHEDPATIIEEICAGISKNKLSNISQVVDRKEAIVKALSMAKPEDTILIAGKGHETYQILGDEKTPFVERKIIESFYLLSTKTTKRVWIEISMKTLARNFELIKKDLPENVELMTVVKDNGTGHGILEMTKQAFQAGCQFFGVACLPEAEKLRSSLDLPISILIFGERIEDEIERCIDLNLSIQVQSFETAAKIASTSLEKNKITQVHFKVDTGMGRYGVRWNKANHVYEKIQTLDGIQIQGVMTHFAQSDELKKDQAKLQWKRFESFLNPLKSKQILPKYIHACNTGGYLDLPFSHGNLVRIGILPTGVYPSEVCRKIQIDGESLQPVMSVKSVVAFIKTLEKGDTLGYGMHFTAIKKTRIGVMPFGYGDGYPRLRNKGHVLVRGKQAPILGGNAMDTTMIDISHIPNIEKGNQVVLIGKQGQNEVTMRQVADWAGTVTYQIMSGWTQRIERSYIY